MEVLPNEIILNAAGEGILGLDRHGNARFVNPAAARMLGREAKELLGRPHHDVFHHTKPNGSPYPRQECPVQRTLQEGAVCRVDHEVFWKKDGSSFPVEYTSTPIRKDDEIVGVVIVFRDVGQRRLLERQLAQTQKLEGIGQLAAGIAHEINTPAQYITDNVRFLEDAFHDLAGLLIQCSRLRTVAEGHHDSAQLLADVVATAQQVDVEYLMEEVPKAISQSLEGVELVARIVRSMREFAYVDTEQKQAIDFNDAIENALTVSRNEWKQIADVVTDLDPKLPLVNCLPAECNQVLLSLILNAAQAIGDKLGNSPAEKGTITIATHRNADWVEIRVEDTGIGIPEEYRSRVFDPFFTTKEVGLGTGQGLALAHFVVTEKHRGSIAFETEAGRGTSFVVRLPIR